jgi:protein-S-isoprenylcysteine O-methyltransferase Ste14
VRPPANRTWRKSIAVVLAAVIVGVLAWVTEVSIYSGGQSPLVRQIGFLTFLGGVVIAAAIVAIFLWRDSRETKDLKAKYGSTEEQDT